MNAREKFHALVLEERAYQDEKWGSNADKTHSAWGATITEEYLEVLAEVMAANEQYLKFTRAVDETKEPLSPEQAARIRKELVQVAALCYKFYEKYPAIQTSE